MFHDGDLQSGIALALRASKAVLCFVQDDSETSKQWEDVLTDASISPAITAQAVALRLQAGSQEAGFLTPFCAISSVPAVIVIKNAQLQTNLQSGDVDVQDLKARLASTFGVQDASLHDQVTAESEHTTKNRSDGEQSTSPGYLDLQPTGPGQWRLPNNAYDALRTYTQKLLDERTAPSEVFQTQLRLLNNIPIFHEEVERLRGQQHPQVSEYLRSRLLRLPAVGLRIPGQNQTASAGQPASPSPLQSSSSPSSPQQQRQQQQRPPNRSEIPTVVPPAGTGITSQTSQKSRSSPAPPAPSPAESDKQKAQRAEYMKMQREREQTQRAERERIKAQIKADREERRRLDEMRKHGTANTTDHQNNPSTTSSVSRPTTTKHAEIRLQVRTFDGSTLRATFQPSSTISADVRPWIDSTSPTAAATPYNLKLILTPLPNRTIEAGEEDMALSDLGVVGSCTLVMVPVKGYVESYTGSTPGGILGAGYTLVTGTAGMVLGGVRSLLGYNNNNSSSSNPTATASSPTEQRDSTPAGRGGAATRNARVRTLADQRAESQGRDQQFYNGNQLNFQPKDDTDKND
ncbi:hypothetical protein HRR90_007114 [Exophiala dermatitidis]|nr:hypothetical protein HRR90_007114 [Exophiala dermatitidis]